MKIRKIILPILIIIVLLVVIKNNVNSIFDTLNNKNSASALEEKLAVEKKKNQYLIERLSYVKTEDFIEEEAKDKLGLLQPGEFFVIAPTSTPLGTAEQIVDDRPNWKKWSELFF